MVKLNLARRPLSRGFTLIELLVVIAIIAILAAILFPVFAQAKMAAKKTQAISNVKNVTTATMIYLSDSDDTFPLAHIIMPGGLTSYNRFIPTPQTLATAYTTAGGLDALGGFYSNSLRPYIKSEQIWNDPVAQSTTTVYNLSITSGTGSSTPPPPAGTSSYSYAMNGLLTSYNATSVAAPAGLILFSQDGMRKTPGCWFANPAMYCPNNSAACVYQKATSTCGTNATVNGDASFFSRSTGGLGFDTYNRQWVVSFADGHAKTRRIGVYSTGKTDPRVDPMASYGGTDGKVTSTMTRWYSAENAGGCHAYMFRPDLDFSTWDAAVENL
jgi:prepilin-type N-terminal cleavage/methylation domain-containing protein